MGQVEQLPTGATAVQELGRAQGRGGVCNDSSSLINPQKGNKQRGSHFENIFKDKILFLGGREMEKVFFLFFLFFLIKHTARICFQV